MSENTCSDATSSESSFSFAPDKNENAFVSLLFNIALPVLILNKATEPLKQYFGENGPTVALIIALIFPLGYGLRDYFKTKRKNAISMLGFVNILLTGGLALFQLEGIWFAVKEAAFPLLIGFFVYLSIYGKKPFIELFIYNKNLLRIDLIESKLHENQRSDDIKRHLRLSTIFLAGSFLLSSILNFVLAVKIFVPIDPTISKSEYTTVLNQQIADMTWLSWFVIMIPSMLCLMAILWHLFAGIQKMTGLKLNDIIHSREADQPQ